MKKRLLAILLVLALVCTLAFSLTACDGAGSTGGDNGEGDQIDPGDKTSGIDVPGVDDPDAAGSNDENYVRG